MKLLILSDIHGDTAYLELLTEEFAVADAVIFAGDFACFKKPETGTDTLQALLKKHETLFAVTGNCDNPDFVEELESCDVCIQGEMVYRDGLFFAGSGGSLKFTGITPNERTEKELIDDLRLVEESSEGENVQTWENLVIVSHQPPQNTKLDLVSAGIHVGSPSLRAFIEKHNPLMCVCGHIHEAASIDALGKTTLINPGSLAEGRYAVAELRESNGWKVISAELRELHEAK